MKFLNPFEYEVALCIPYNLKQKLDLSECNWSNVTKLWYYKNTSLDCEDPDILDKYELVYLKAGFNDKDFIKKNGGVWNNDKKEWYTYKSNDILTKKFKFETTTQRIKRENDEYFAKNKTSNYESENEIKIEEVIKIDEESKMDYKLLYTQLLKENEDLKNKIKLLESNNDKIKLILESNN
jgi:hypothetical protein